MSHVEPRELLSEFLGAELEALHYGPEEDAWYFAWTKATLRTDCPWRFALADGSVLGPGDLSHVERPEAPRHLPVELRPLVERAVLSEAQVSPSGDLRLEFTNGVQLALLCTLRMYENWTIDLADGRSLCAGPGGLLVASRRSP